MNSAGTFLITYAAHSLAFAVVALSSARLLAHYGSIRCAVWKSALVLPLLTSWVVLARPGREPVSVTAVAGRLVPVTPARLDVDVREIRGQPTSRVERVRDPVGHATSVFLVILALVGALRSGFFFVRRSHFHRAIDHRWPESAAAFPVLGGIPVIETDLVDVPVALATGVIALPKGFSDAGTENSRNAILLHERAHIERRDPAWLDFARFISAATPWQPLNRIMVDRLERDTELAADARALSLGAEASSLIEGLAQFATRSLSPSAAGASLVRAESPLVQRAHALLENTRVRPAGPAVITASVVSLLVVTVAIAAVPPLSPGGITVDGRPPSAAQLIEIDVREGQPGR